MILLRQLLGAQFVHLGHLPRQGLTGLESLRVQNHLQGGQRNSTDKLSCQEYMQWSPPEHICYLCNEGVVRHHHGYGPEQSLQVVRQLGSSGVTWVHGDERSARHHQLDLFALKQKLCQLDKRKLSETFPLNSLPFIYIKQIIN